MENIETKQGEIRLIYEDADVIAFSKPAGLLSQGAEGTGEASVMEYLKEYLGGAEVLPVHRLDRMTGGVMIAAKNKGSAAELTRLITDGAMNKEYLAVVHGQPQGGVLEDFLFFDRKRDKSFVVKKDGRRGVKRASLEYYPISTATDCEKQFTLIRVRLHTGRTHQIRVQLANAGHPLLGDGKYGGGWGKHSTALHSCRITFRDGAMSGYFRKRPFAKALAEKPDLLSSTPTGYPWDMYP